MIVENRSPDRVTFRISGALYGPAVVFKCFYWYGDRYAVVIEPADNQVDYLVVTLRPLRGELSSEEIQVLEARVARDLIDFKTRDIVARETQVVRELIVAKAFENGEYLREEEEEPTAARHRTLPTERTGSKLT